SGSRGDGARREAPHVGPLGPALALDREAGGLHRALGVAIRMTPAAGPRPEWLHAVLKFRLPPSARANVLEHAEPSAGSQHALDFGQAARRLGHAAEDQAGHDRVEAPVAERRGRAAPRPQRARRRAAPRAPERIPGWIEADHAHVRRVERQAATGPAADVERVTARAGGEAVAPRGPTAPLQ